MDNLDSVLDPAKRTIDISIVTNKSRACVSPILKLFNDSRLGDPYSRLTALRSYQDSSHPFSEVAQTKKWQKRLNRSYKKSGIKLSEFFLLEYMRAAPESLIDLPDHIDKMLADDDRVGQQWSELERMIESIKETSNHRPFNMVLEFILTYRNTEFDGVEMQLMMILATLELYSVACGQSIAKSYLDDSMIFVPRNLFVPTAKEGKLSTSRYQLADYLIKNIINDNDRNVEHLRGGARWREYSPKIEVRTLNIQKASLHIFPELLGTKWHEIFTHPYRTMLRYSVFFEWMQLRMFEEGFKADEIEDQYTRIESVRNRFYTDLLDYSSNTNRYV